MGNACARMFIYSPGSQFLLRLASLPPLTPLPIPPAPSPTPSLSPGTHPLLLAPHPASLGSMPPGRRGEIGLAGWETLFDLFLSRVLRWRTEPGWRNQSYSTACEREKLIIWERKVSPYFFFHFSFFVFRFFPIPNSFSSVLFRFLWFPFIYLFFLYMLFFIHIHMNKHIHMHARTHEFHVRYCSLSLPLFLFALFIMLKRCIHCHVVYIYVSAALSLRRVYNLILFNFFSLAIFKVLCHVAFSR